MMKERQLQLALAMAYPASIYRRKAGANLRPIDSTGATRLAAKDEPAPVLGVEPEPCSIWWLQSLALEKRSPLRAVWSDHALLAVT